MDSENTDFDTIDLRGNSRALIVSSGSSHVSINTILSDSAGQIFIAPSQSVSIFTQLSPCLVAFNASVLAFGKKIESNVVIHRTLHLFGKLDFKYSPSVQIGLYGGSFIMQPGSFPNQFDLKSFAINDNSGYQVSLLQDNDVKILNITGGNFILGTRSSLNCNAQLTLLANNVIINGVMTAPILTSAVWNSLSVGSTGSLDTNILSNSLRSSGITVHGSLSFRNANMSINVNNLAVSGTITLAGVVKLFDKIGASKVSLTVYQNGMFKIIGNSGFNTSEIGARYIDIYGQFYAGFVKPSGGWNRLRVFQGGSMVVQFKEHLRIDAIEISGSLKVMSVVKIVGLTLMRTKSISLAPGSTFILNSQKEAGVSTIRASNIEVNGTFAGGRVTPLEGWDRVYVGPQGNFNLELTEKLCTDEITVYGNLDVKNNVSFCGYTGERVNRLVVGTGGSFIINSLRTGTSYLRISNVEIMGRFVAGNASAVEGWNRLTVQSQGYMNIYFIGEFRVDHLEVTGTMEVTNNVTIRGRSTARTGRVVINPGGLLKLNAQKIGISYLRMSIVEVNGQFLIGSASTVEGWDRLTVESQGNMNIYFIGEFRVDHVEVTGTLEVTNNATIRGYTTARTGRVVISAGGLFKMNAQKIGISYLRMSIVEVNGQFLIGSASTVEGWDRLFIKPQGTVKTKFTSDFQIDRLEVSGNLEIQNSVNVRGFTENRTRDLIINSGGSITLDSQKTSKVSVLRVYNVSINGRFQGGNVSAGGGWNYFTIGSEGSMTIRFHDALHVDHVTISGDLVVSNAVKILGFSDFKTSEIKLESGSSVKLMAESYNVNCGEKKAYSELQVLQLSINGLFQADALSIHDGINDFVILPNGNFQFYPVSEFWFNRFNVNGKMTSYRDIIIEGRHNFPIAHAQFGPSADAVIKRCFNDSRIIADRVTVEGKLVTDLLKIGNNWKNLTVTGTFEFIPADTFNITQTVVSGNWRSIKPFSDDKPLQGNTLVVNLGGVISLNYQKTLDDPMSGSIPSIIKMVTSIAIHGRFEAGSVSMVTNDLKISTGGRLSVDWGGYASGQGPGAGSAASAGSSGASHAGRGGKGAGVSCHRLPYGSIYTKGSWGSGGGHAGNMGGRGGGKVHLEVRQSVQLDGGIQASGEPGKVSFRFTTLPVKPAFVSHEWCYANGLT